MKKHMDTGPGGSKYLKAVIKATPEKIELDDDTFMIGLELSETTEEYDAHIFIPAGVEHGSK